MYNVPVMKKNTTKTPDVLKYKHRMTVNFNTGTRVFKNKSEKRNNRAAQKASLRQSY